MPFDIYAGDLLLDGIVCLLFLALALAIDSVRRTHREEPK